MRPWRLDFCRPLHVTLGLLAVLGIGLAPATAEDHLVFRRDRVEVQASGKILVEAQDGGVLLQDRLGRLWPIQPDAIVKRTADELPYQRLDGKPLERALLAEMPDGFRVHKTAHYMVVYNTSPAYAQWCGALFERLYRAFTNFWSRRGMKLHDPETRMVAIVFADKASYRRYAVEDLGDAVDSIVGYYNLFSNRVVMYDLTGDQAAPRSRGGKGRSSVEINRMLSRPEAGSLVATVIHEATHQIAFNCGLMTRLADIPIWLSEGIAMYFETPDLGSSKGWRGIGAVNQNRLDQFRKYASHRPVDSLKQLLQDDRRIQGRSEDERFQGREALLSAYAESWCLTYYLLKNKPKPFLAYIQTLSEKPALGDDGPKVRLDQFRQHLGDLNSTDADFLRQMRRLR